MCHPYNRCLISLSTKIFVDKLSYNINFNSGTKMYFETKYNAGKFELTDNYQLQIELSDEACSQVALQVKTPGGSRKASPANHWFAGLFIVLWRY